MDKIMDTLYDIRDYLRDNWMNVFAGGLIVVLLIGFMMFIASVLMPQLEVRSELAVQVASAQEALDREQMGKDSLPDSLNAQIASSRARRDELATVFMSETQAGDALNNLYRYAEQTDIEVIDLQVQAEVETAVKGAYDARVFRMQAEGEVSNLLTYITQISEASIPSFAVQMVEIGESTDPETSVVTNSLVMDFVLYTSPYATGTAVAVNTTDGEPTSIIPTPMAPPVSELDALKAQLDLAWAAENWPEVLTILQKMLALNPNDAELTQKQYAAHVNYGYGLLDRQQLTEAQAQFDAALAVNPDGVEAVIGKKQAEIAALAPQLDGLWASQNWSETIRLLEAIMAIDPNYDDVRGKLYAAHVNYGYQLLDQQQAEAARTQFEQALTLNPDGVEAKNGIQAAGGSAPASPGEKTYIVRAGDTLFSISRRYGITVDALKAANGLSSNRINVNQVLIIP